MTVLQVLPEVICSEELFSVVAFAKFVHFLQMHDTQFPILLRCYGDLVSTRSW